MIYLQIKCQTEMVYRKNFISREIRQIDISYIKQRHLFLTRFGRKTAKMPNSGNNVVISKTYLMLVASASHPKNTEPIPPKANESP